MTPIKFFQIFLIILCTLFMGLNFDPMLHGKALNAFAFFICFFGAVANLIGAFL